MRSPLLAGLIDYAGVFPPAQLPVADAEREYAAVVTSQDGWVVGPMLVLASQHHELTARPAQLGLVADAAIPDDAAPLTQVERKVTVDEVAEVGRRLTTSAPVVYLESATPGDLAVLEPIARLREVGLDVRAKIRTGGATAAAFPTPAEVAAFIGGCVTLGLPFKATAGLHHPVRHASQVPEATEHGFVNVIAATRCALAGDAEATLRALEETSIDAFDVPTATWRGIGAEIDAERVRATFRSIGSCSFHEPVGYLRDLGML